MFHGEVNLALRQPQAKINNGRQPSNDSAPLSRWSALAAQLNAPDFELVPEEFAAIYREYARLKSRGHVFDPMLVALMLCLQRQVLRTDDGLEDFERELDATDDERNEDPWSAPLSFGKSSRLTPTRAPRERTYMLDARATNGSVEVKGGTHAALA